MNILHQFWQFLNLFTVSGLPTATSKASEYMDTVLRQNYAFYKIQKYALCSLRGRVESKQGRIIIQTCIELFCNFESFLY